MEDGRNDEQPHTPSLARTVAGRLLCIANHRWGEFGLRPRWIGVRVEWLRWERTCQRCWAIERRWFKVKLPSGLKMGGIGHAIRVEDYLKRIRQSAPDPLSVPPSSMPAELTRKQPFP